jgi:prepilin-type N-terminal cleavage/methylation domain-containing protein
MKKNGFTLIELLSVIIILSVIMLIATTVITNSIKTSEKEAFVTSTNELVKKLQLDRTENSITIPNAYTVSSSGVAENSSGRGIKFKHLEGITGTISFDDLGNYTLLLKNDKYCTRRNNTDRRIEVFTVTSTECN